MAAITYDDLIRRVPQWLYAQNRSLVLDMDDIVRQAHDQLIGVLDHDLFRTIITGETMTAASMGVLDLSAEDPPVLEVRSIRVRYRDGVDDWTPLQRRNLETLTMLYARNRPSRPLYYSEYNGPLIIKAFPAPKQDYELEIAANVEPPVLSQTTADEHHVDPSRRALSRRPSSVRPPSTRRTGRTRRCTRKR